MNGVVGTSKVRRPKGSEGYPEVTVRESPDELTLRAEEVVRGSHTSKSTTLERRGALVDTDWHGFCQALCKGIEGEDLGELYDACKEMSSAVEVKKPQEAQKAKASLENEGSQGCRRKKTTIPRVKTTSWEETRHD